MSPEHGFKGVADAGEKVNDELYLDSIPVVSLYGQKRKPDPEDLSNVDILVFDIQDVGVRFYTYISTLHYIMESAVENGIPVMVLDRPNPNGHYVDGPIREQAYQSFIGMHPVPVVYGLTIGEYARMINGEGWLPDGGFAELSVIPCSDYSHRSRYVLPVAPSPNLPNERAILLYPSLCFFEGTTLSVGRGTTTQFQVYGHPQFVDGSYEFTPVSSFGSKYPKHKNQKCMGVSLISLKPTEIRTWGQINLEFLLGAFKMFEENGIAFFNDNNHLEKLAGTDDLREQIVTGKTAVEIRMSWQKGLDEFKETRKKYLLYEDF